jgi:uncharacterized membrane protein
MHQVKSALIAISVFLAMDLIWLGYLGKQLYLKEMGPFFRSDGINYLAAAMVYSLLVCGILVFVIPKAHGDPIIGLAWGALFGLVCYGTYDLTNLAVVNKWPLMISIIDMIWGAIVCGVTSYVTIWLK